MTLPILHHDNVGAIIDYSPPMEPRPGRVNQPAPHGNFPPGLRIIVIQPDGCEERCIACWGETEERLLRGDSGAPVLLPPPRRRHADR